MLSSLSKSSQPEKGLLAQQLRQEKALGWQSMWHMFMKLKLKLNAYVMHMLRSLDC